MIFHNYKVVLRKGMERHRLCTVCKAESNYQKEFI